MMMNGCKLWSQIRSMSPLLAACILMWGNILQFGLWICFFVREYLFVVEYNVKISFYRSYRSKNYLILRQYEQREGIGCVSSVRQLFVKKTIFTRNQKLMCALMSALLKMNKIIAEVLPCVCPEREYQCVYLVVQWKVSVKSERKNWVHFCSFVLLYNIWNKNKQNTTFLEIFVSVFLFVWVFLYYLNTRVALTWHDSVSSGPQLI